MRNIIILAALSASVAMPVAAQDNYDWSGSYAGVTSAYVLSSSDKSFVSSPDELRHSFGMEGAMFGLQAGYLASFDNFVLGVEGNVLFGRLNGNDSHHGSSYEEMTVQNLASLSARFGYAVDTVLLYGKAGVSTGSVEMITYRSHDPSSRYEAITSQYAGPSVGAGVEIAVTDNVRLRADYNLHFLGGKEHPWANWSDAIYRLNRTQDVRLGVSYSF